MASETQNLPVGAPKSEPRHEPRARLEPNRDAVNELLLDIVQGHSYRKGLLEGIATNQKSNNHHHSVCLMCSIKT